MKLLLEFGVPARKKREVTWNTSSNIRDFPSYIKLDGIVWEFIAFDKAKGIHDYVLMFGEVSADKIDADAQFQDFDDMFNRYMDHYKCQCGAAYERGFENVHSFWCPKWEKV